MSIHLKLFLAFSVVVALAVGSTYYGIRAVSEAGGLVVRLYDEPFMAVSHARAAQVTVHVISYTAGGRTTRKERSKTASQLPPVGSVQYACPTRSAMTIAPSRAATTHLPSRLSSGHEFTVGRI